MRLRGRDRCSWTTRVPVSTEDRSRLYVHFSPSPLLDGQTVYAPTFSGDLVAVDIDSGDELWRASTGSPIFGAPAIADGSIVVGSHDNNVHSVDAETGEIRWVFDTLGPIVSTPAVHDDLVIVGTRGYDLYALSAADAKVAWRDYSWFSWVESSAVVHANTVYIGSSDAGHLLALTANNGKRKWTFDTTGSAWATPAVAGDVVYIGSVGVAQYIVDHTPGFFAVNAETGQAIWSYIPEPDPDSHFSGFAGSPLVGECRVYVAGLDGEVRAFARSDANASECGQ